MALQAQKTGRASRSFAQLWQVPTFLVGLTAFILVAATAPLRQDPTIPAFAADIAFIRNALTKNACDSGVQALSESLVARASKFPDRLGEAHFLAGSVHQQLADAAADVQQIDLRHKASVHLERAMSLGVPAGDAGILSFSLGRLLFENGGDMRRAGELLTRSLESKAVPPVLGYALLTKVHVRAKNLQGALAANQKHLDAIDKKHELEETLLLRGELWMQQGNRVEALKALDRISPKAADKVRIRARLLQARCTEAEGLWTRAVAFWRELANHPDQAGGQAHVLYHLGWCLANNGPESLSEACKIWFQCSELGGPEGQAALIRLAEFSLRGAEPNSAAAVEFFTKAMVTVPSAADYQNAILDLGAVRNALEGVCAFLEKARDYQNLQQLAEVYKRIAAPGAAEEWLARGLEAEAKTLRERPDAGPESQAAYQKAGEAFELAARARPAGARADVLWRAASAYLAGNDVIRAVVVLERFVQEEKTEERLAEGWLRLAEAYSAIGKQIDARSAYYKCIEYPTTAVAFRARYRLAIDEAASKNFEQAYEILKQNLESTGPAIDRDTHEKSLFKLGELMFANRDYDKACIYLKEAVERYPNHATAVATRDHLADCYRKLGDIAHQRFKEKKERNYKLARDGWMDKAASEYDRLTDLLTAKAADDTLNNAEAQILLRARISAAELQLERGDPADALRRTYDTFKNYPNRHIARFMAFQRMTRCWEAIRTSENKQLVQQARENIVTSAELLLMDVPRMQDSDRPFTPQFGRSQWAEYLRDWVARLSPPAGQQAR